RARGLESAADLDDPAVECPAVADLGGNVDGLTIARDADHDAVRRGEVRLENGHALWGGGGGKGLGGGPPVNRAIGKDRHHAQGKADVAARVAALVSSRPVHAEDHAPAACLIANIVEESTHHQDAAAARALEIRIFLNVTPDTGDVEPLALVGERPAAGL